MISRVLVQTPAKENGHLKVKKLQAGSVALRQAPFPCQFIQKASHVLLPITVRQALKTKNVKSIDAASGFGNGRHDLGGMFLCPPFREILAHHRIRAPSFPDSRLRPPRSHLMSLDRIEEYDEVARQEYPVRQLRRMRVGQKPVQRRNRCTARYRHYENR